MGDWDTIDFEIEGIAWLLMHNIRLADPLDEYAKDLSRYTSKRKMSDSDHQRVSDIEWEGGLYRDDDDHVVIPGYVIEGCVFKAARKRKLGPTFKASFYVEGDWPLIYPGPKNLDALKADHRFRDRRAVRLNGSKVVMRTRPKFAEWALKFTCNYEQGSLNRDQVIEVLSMGTIGDYAPKYGRFKIVSPAA